MLTLSSANNYRHYRPRHRHTSCLHHFYCSLRRLRAHHKRCSNCFRLSRFHCARRHSTIHQRHFHRPWQPHLNRFHTFRLGHFQQYSNPHGRGRACSCGLWCWVSGCVGNGCLPAISARICLFPQYFRIRDGWSFLRWMLTDLQLADCRSRAIIVYGSSYRFSNSIASALSFGEHFDAWL